MKKLVALLLAGVAVGMFSGCNLNPAGATKVDVVISTIGPVVVGGGAGAVTGSISSDSALTNVAIKVLNSSDADVSTSFTLTYLNAWADKKNVDLKTDLGLTIAAKSTVTAGTYKLKITGTSGSVEGTLTKDFAVTGGSSSDLTLDTATLGNTANTTAGTIDLDNGSLSKADEVTASNVGSIDICYANGSSTDRFYVAKAAKYGTTDNKTIKTTAAGFTFTDSWPATGYSDVVRIMPITSAQFDGATTAAAIEALYDATSALVYAPVTDGATFVVKTSSSAYVLMKVLSYTAGISGTVEFKYAK